VSALEPDSSEAHRAVHLSMTVTALSALTGPGHENRGYYKLAGRSDQLELPLPLPVDGGSPFAGLFWWPSLQACDWEMACHGYKNRNLNPALYEPSYDYACVRVLLSHVSSHLVSDKKSGVLLP
jgi:hypothetical protein